MTKTYELLGLARRAGAIAPGTEAVRQAIRDGEARLVVLADDASPTQSKKIERTLGQRPIPSLRFGDSAGLGAAVGLAHLSAVAVTSASLAERVQAEMERSTVATTRRAEV